MSMLDIMGAADAAHVSAAVQLVSWRLMWRGDGSRTFMGVEAPDDGFEQYVAKVRRRLWRAFVAVRGVPGADDALAEALAWAWEHRERLATMENPTGYLYRVGVTRSAPPRRPLTLPEPAELEIPEVEPGLIPALLGLSENQRASVWLVHGCGWSYAEVAEALDIGRSTVGTHVSRALITLREQLELSPHA